MLRGLVARTAAGLLAAAAALLALSPPASAIQTTTWGLEPAPTANGPRPSLSYPSNGQTVHDAVMVYNRTAQPEVITLSVLDATRSNGTYQYSTARKGLSSGVSLAAERIALPPHEQARVPVTIKLPSHSKITVLAAIAAKGAPVHEGSLIVQQQLVILVKATPSTTAPVVPDIGMWGPAAGGLLAVVGGLACWQAWKRRRSLPLVVVPAGAPQPAAGIRAGAATGSE